MKAKLRNFRRLLLCVTPLAALVASLASPRPAQASVQECYNWCEHQFEVMMYVCLEELNNGNYDAHFWCTVEAFENRQLCIANCNSIGDPGCDPFFDPFCVPQDEDF